MREGESSDGGGRHARLENRATLVFALPGKVGTIAASLGKARWMVRLVQCWWGRLMGAWAPKQARARVLLTYQYEVRHYPLHFD